MNYNIFAKLQLKTAGATAGANRITTAVERLQNRLRGTSSLTSGLTRSLIGMAAGVAGIHAIASGTRSLIGSTIAYSAELERMKIGLSAVMSQVDGISFAAGMEQATGIFERLRDASITSTATAADMMNIFQQIAGPIRNAGTSIADIESITASAVHAASALGVDFNQAARDIQMMARGVAGTDVKLFSLLRSTGAITESTEEWNNALTAGERVERLQSALSSFDSSADAAGRSWAGVTSTFRGLMDELKLSFGGPMIAQLNSFLQRINTLIIGRRTSMFSGLTSAGEAAAQSFGHALDWAFDRVEYLVSNWDSIITKIRSVASYIQSITPTVIKFAKAAALMSVAKSAAVMGLGVVGAGSRVAGAVGAAGRMAGFGRGAAAAGSVAQTAGGLGGIGSAMGASASAALGLTNATSGLAASFAAVAGPIGLVVAGLLSVGGLFTFLTNHLSFVGDVLERIVMPVFGYLGEALEKLYHSVEPLLDLLGGAIFATIVLVVTGLAGGLGLLIDAIATAIEWVTDFAKMLYDLAVGVDDPVKEIANASAEAQDSVFGVPEGIERPNMQLIGPPALRQAEEAAGGRRSGTNINVKNMNIKQEFRQADPDRVLVRMRQDIERAAAQRVGSGFAPVLSG